MATSGSVSSNGYEGRYITFSWSLTSQSIKNNTSTIAWRLEGDGTGEVSRYKAGNFKVVIDGVTVYSTSSDARIWLYDGTLVASGNYTFTHNNAGAKSFSVSIQAGIYTYAVNCTGSGSFALPIINRVSTITAVNGANTSDVLSVNYTEYVSSYTNNLIIRLGATDLMTITDYTSGAEFTLTDEALETIYSTITSSTTATLLFSLQTFSGSLLIGTSDVVGKTLTINDSAPSMGAISYQDINTTTTAITGDNHYIIRNNSVIALSIANITALNEATIANIAISGGGIEKTIYLGVEYYDLINENLGTVNQSGDFTLTITVTDSRGFKVTKTITILVYDWVLPTATITAQRVDNYYTTTNVTVNASYSSLGNKNAVTITARYKKTSDSSYGADVALTDGVTSALTLDNNYEWNLQIIVADKIGSTTYNLVVGRGLPIWFIDRLLNSIGFNCFPQQSNSLEVNGLRLDDKVYIGSQEIYDKYELSTARSVTLACAYDYKFIENIFAGVDIPENYEKAYKITFQYSTASSNIINVSLNNIVSNDCNTWSNNTYRLIGSTKLFKESELTLENVNGTTRQGLNLKLSNSAAYGAYVWGITLHGYLIHKDTDVSAIDISEYDITPEQA